MCVSSCNFFTYLDAGSKRINLFICGQILKDQTIWIGSNGLSWREGLEDWFGFTIDSKNVFLFFR